MTAVKINLVTIDLMFIVLGLTLGTIYLFQPNVAAAGPWFLVSAISWVGYLTKRVTGKYIIYLRDKLKKHEDK